MALVKCRECSKETNKAAKACPGCGGADLRTAVEIYL